MSERNITGAMITAVMRPGQSYQSAGIAKTFGITPANMRIELARAVAAGLIDHRTNNGTHLYSLPVAKGPAPAMKPYRVPREMQQAVARCKELRQYPSRFD